MLHMPAVYGLYLSMSLAIMMIVRLVEPCYTYSWFIAEFMSTPSDVYVYFFLIIDR